jgi:membrane associated rhomboid family serine protease
MTLAELRQGEVWRALTATFVHYGLLHLGLNLWMFYQLGAEIESWYGSAQFTALYVLIGGGGNLISGLARTLLRANPQVHYGGGSVVVLGLVALLAVVGWRSRTPFGNYVRSQMVWVLIATAVLGVLVPIVDNWGHAGGALIGAAIGFAHRPLYRNARTRLARTLGAIAVLVLVVGAIAQFRDDRQEWSAHRRREESVARYRAAAATRERLTELGVFYNVAIQRSLCERFVPKAFLRQSPRSPATRYPRIPPLLESTDATFRAALQAQLDWLDSAREELGTGPTALDYRRVRNLLKQVFMPSPNDLLKQVFMPGPNDDLIFNVRRFHTHLAALIRRAQQDEQAARIRVEALSRPG